MMTLLTENSEDFDTDFHKTVWRQFSDFWGRVSWPLTLQFEALTTDTSAVEGLFGYFDIAAILTFANPAKERFQIILPCQPLIVFLRGRDSLEFSEAPPLLRPVRL